MVTGSGLAGTWKDTLMSVYFEALMLVCFGMAWPLSILKSYRSRQNGGKSLWFMLTILIGYLSGMLYKLTGNLDPVVYLYGLNGIMVLIDILIYIRNDRLQSQSRRLK